jgi:hypothetical protein
MSNGEGDGWDAPGLEAALWGVTALLASVLAFREPRGARVGWWIVAAATTLIVLDKVVDIYSFVHAVGASLASGFDPEHMRGRFSMLRTVGLGVTFVVGCGGLFWLARTDAAFGRGKRLCFLGLAVVIGLLVVRLVPAAQGYLPAVVTKVIEAAAWLMVLVGECLGSGRRPSLRARPGGFFVA